MRKKAIVFLLVLLSIASISAENLQKVYTTRDSIYKRVEALCSQAGVIGPSSFSPMPARALIIALDRINPETLSQAEIKEYNELYSILTGKDHLVQEDAVDPALVDVIHVLDAQEDALLHAGQVAPMDVEDVREVVQEIVLDHAVLIVLMDVEEVALHHVVIHAVLDVKVV